MYLQHGGYLIMSSKFQSTHCWDVANDQLNIYDHEVKYHHLTWLLEAYLSLKIRTTLVIYDYQI